MLTQMYWTSFSTVFSAAGALLACFDLQGRLSQETPVNQLCTTEETQVCLLSFRHRKKSLQVKAGTGMHTQKYKLMVQLK